LTDNGNLVKTFSQPATGKSNADYETFTLTFEDDVETRVSGAAFSVKLQLSYTDKFGASKQEEMEIAVQDALCGCPARTANTGANSDWLTFQCHNLGGKDILTGNETLDYTYHGDWYRFGSKTASVVNLGTNTGAQGWTTNDIEGQQNPDYQAPSEDDLNQKDKSGNILWKAENNPCPAGWRIPTHAEWAAAINKREDNGNLPSTNNSLVFHPSTTWYTNNNIFNHIMQIGDYLFLPAAGARDINGEMMVRAYRCDNWTSSASAANAWFFSAGTDSWAVNSYSRQYAMSVRCVAAE
jgi:uncharacterized protein (TIGR02145 family)